MTGRTAVVTGAGGGLGRAYVVALAACGAQVVVNDVDVAAARSVVAEITAAGGIAVVDGHSTAEPDDASAIIGAALDAFGSVDVVVANAMVHSSADYAALRLEEFDAALGVGLSGAYFVTRAALPHMTAAGHGRVVFVTSSTATYPRTGRVGYAAAKGGVRGLAASLAPEAQPHGVLVNTLCPYAVTGRAAQASDRHADLDLRMDGVIAVLLALVADDCPVTGETLVVGAGGVARLVPALSLVVRERSADALTPGTVRDALRAPVAALHTVADMDAEVRWVAHGDKRDDGPGSAAP